MDHFLRYKIKRNWMRLTWDHLKGSPRRINFFDSYFFWRMGLPHQVTYKSTNSHYKISIVCEPRPVHLNWRPVVIICQLHIWKLNTSLTSCSCISSQHWFASLHNVFPLPHGNWRCLCDGIIFDIESHWRVSIIAWIQILSWKNPSVGVGWCSDVLLNFSVAF